MPSDNYSALMSAGSGRATLTRSLRPASALVSADSVVGLNDLRFTMSIFLSDLKGKNIKISHM